MSKSLIFWLAILLLFSGGAAVWSAFRLSQNRGLSNGSAVELDKAPKNVEILKDFRLTERSGQKISSDDLKGHVYVASFFFSSCPGTCRSQNLEIMALQNKYAKDGVKFVSITCDPQNDTLAKLREYADSFKARPDSWYFLTGDMDYIRRIGAEIFSVHVDEGVHMDRLMLVDKWGNVRGHFDWRNPLELTDMKKHIEQLVAEETPPAEVTPYVSGMSGISSSPASSEEEEEEEDAATAESEEPSPVGAEEQQSEPAGETVESTN